MVMKKIEIMEERGKRDSVAYEKSRSVPVMVCSYMVGKKGENGRKGKRGSVAYKKIEVCAVIVYAGVVMAAKKKKWKKEGKGVV